MSFDVLMSKIDLNGNPDYYNDKIIGALQEIYGNGFGKGSDFLRGLLNMPPEKGKLIIKPIPESESPEFGPYYVVKDHTIYIDIFTVLGVVNFKGDVYVPDLVEWLIHELTHALENTFDPPNGGRPATPENPSGGREDFTQPNPDYVGGAVSRTNEILEDIYGEGAEPYEDYRVTYSGASKFLYDNLSQRTNWTNGNEIDTVLLTTKGNPERGSVGSNPDTSKNTERVRDLIIDISKSSDGGEYKNNNIASGLGDDFIYGREGRDTINGGAGNDYIDGGNGTDTVKFSYIDGDASGSISHGATLTFSESGIAAIDGWGGVDELISVEHFHLTEFDDTLVFSDDFLVSLGDPSAPENQYFIVADHGTNTQDSFGDTIELRTSHGVNVDLGFSVKATTETFGVHIHGFENVIGSEHNDILTGNLENNRLDGGGGADQIDGGGGNDTITFDADDTVVKGGEGRDVGRVSEASGAVTVDLSTAELEVLVGGSGNDTITANGVGHMAAGGAGADTFNVELGHEDGPTVIWGGEGADVIDFTRDSNIANRSAGILVVNVSDLTEENFHLFDKSMIEGLPADFDWSQIDVIVLNPDASDRITRFGDVQGVKQGKLDVFDAGSLADDPIETVTFSTPLGVSGSSYADSYKAAFLSSSIVNVFAAGASVGYVEYFQPETWNGSGEEVDDSDAPNLAGAIDGETFHHEYGTGHHVYGNIGYLFASPNGSTIAGPHADLLKFVEFDSTVEVQSEPLGVSSVGQLPAFTTSKGIGPWFIVGGSFEGTSLVGSGQYTATIGDPGDTQPGGGASGGWSNPNDYTNLDSNSPQQITVTTFNTTTGAVVLDGVPINPNAPPEGASVSQVGSHTVLTYGDGGTVVLLGVSLAAWQSGAAAQIAGTSGNDSLSGHNDDNVFVSGSGNDTITAFGGDDTIVYTSGNDVIIGKNRGSDTLDLSQYSAAEVTFSITGHDVLITTPDGTITLEDQAKYVVGHINTNIEQITFSDGTLDGVGIRDRAINDQVTSGDDAITGSHLSDTIAGADGNDTIRALFGDDMIVYSSGNDVILGANAQNRGNDTLDLSKYTATELTFSISGDDVLITTPNGVITLEDQARHDVGHINTNIEQITFSDGTLDGADIRDRAVNDQATSGDDVITGSRLNDTITSAGGNDTITAGGGDDTIVYTSGNDVILGNSGANRGSDTLDLSKYTAAEVQFAVSGQDVTITTPDGVITLEKQLKYAIGDVKTNIEAVTFSDGTLDDAGIRDRAVNDGAPAVTQLAAGPSIATKPLLGLGSQDGFIFKVPSETSVGAEALWERLGLEAVKDANPLHIATKPLSNLIHDEGFLFKLPVSHVASQDEPSPVNWADLTGLTQTGTTEGDSLFLSTRPVTGAAAEAMKAPDQAADLWPNNMDWHDHSILG